MIPREILDAAKKITQLCDLAFEEDSNNGDGVTYARYEALLMAEAIIHSAISRHDRFIHVREMAKKETPKN